MPLDTVTAVGDAISHGGVVVSGSPTTKVEVSTIFQSIARVGDAVVCDLHGSQTIVVGAGISLVLEDNGLAVALNGAQTSCGASVTATQAFWMSE